MTERGYRWAWEQLEADFNKKIEDYENHERDLSPQARGWLTGMRFMRRQMRQLQRKMNREGARQEWGEAVDEMWRTLRDEGETHCVACDRYMKVYPRKILPDMARFLLWLVHRHQQSGQWSHVREYSDTRSGDYAKLLYWDLIEPRYSDDGSGRRQSGYWRPTEDGVRFALGHLAVARHALVFDNAVEGYAGGAVFIREALGTRFDYDELMQKWPIRHIP